MSLYLDETMGGRTLRCMRGGKRAQFALSLYIWTYELNIASRVAKAVIVLRVVGYIVGGCTRRCGRGGE